MRLRMGTYIRGSPVYEIIGKGLASYRPMPYAKNMEDDLTYVPHNLQPVIGWLRMHIANGSVPTSEQMQAMVDKLYAAEAAARNHQCQ